MFEDCGVCELAVIQTGQKRLQVWWKHKIGTGCQYGEIPGMWPWQRAG